jgi:hypothetical protein
MKVRLSASPLPALGIIARFEIQSASVIVRRSRRAIPALVLILIAILAWPWGLALSAMEGPGRPACERSNVGAKRASPGKRAARSTRWVAATPPAFVEDDEESREEGDDADTPPVHFFLDARNLASFSVSTPARVALPTAFLHPHPIARLCRLRC